jgi:hypothetical protein
MITTAERAYYAVAKRAEAIRNDEPATIATMSPGDSVRQGDLYLTCLDEALPRTTGPWPGGRQLAPGASRGSRHVAAGVREVLIVAMRQRLRPRWRASSRRPQVSGSSSVRSCGRRTG